MYLPPRRPRQRKGERREGPPKGQGRGKGRGGGVAGSAPKRASVPLPGGVVSPSFLHHFTPPPLHANQNKNLINSEKPIFTKKQKIICFTRILIFKNDIFEPRRPGTLLGTPQSLNLLILRWAPLNATSNYIVATYKSLSKQIPASAINFTPPPPWRQKMTLSILMVPKRTSSGGVNFFRVFNIILRHRGAHSG